MDVEHQAMAVFGDRREREGLRLYLGFEIQHQAHHARAVARDAQALDVGILGDHLAIELAERRGHLGLEIEHQPLGLLDREHLVLELGLGLEREARVIARRPDAARDDLCFSGA